MRSLSNRCKIGGALIVVVWVFDNIGSFKKVKD